MFTRCPLYLELLYWHYSYANICIRYYFVVMVMSAVAASVEIAVLGSKSRFLRSHVTRST